MGDNLTLDDIKDYVDARGGARQCEACGHREWSAITELGEKGHMPVVLALDSSLSVIGAALFHVVILSCNHCGNVRMISREFVLRWKAERSNG